MVASTHHCGFPAHLASRFAISSPSVWELYPMTWNAV